MTTTVRSWANSAGGNNISGGLFREGQQASTVNDSARQIQAAVRDQWNQAEWFALGDLSGDATYTFLSGTSFRVQGTALASRYHAGRRVRAIGTATGIITGTIVSSANVSGNTDVTVAWDSGALQSEALLIELAIMTANGSTSHPAKVPHDMEFGGNVSVGATLGVAGGASVSGNVTAAGGSFTNGPFSLISAIRRLSGGASITVPNGTRQIVLEIWGAGGGGSSEGASFQGGDGQTLTVTSSPGTHQIVVPGGSRGGGSPINAGQNQEASTGVSSAGAFAALLDIPGGGAPGGAGASGGITGNHGHFVRAVINSTGISSFSLSGGNGGAGGIEPPNGGAGGRASVIASFYG